MKTILLTGAAGYIGSHVWCALDAAGYSVLGLDNFSNSRPQVISKIEEVINKKSNFIQSDIRDKNALRKIFSQYQIQAVVHFAAFKAVGESVKKPLLYYDNNVVGLLSLLEVMDEFNVKNIIFSSSATVYGNPAQLPITEDFPLSAMNPYGQTKLIGEQILKDLQKADVDWRIGCLRYFNPVGAHPSGLIGEDPSGIPNNLMPYVAQVAIGQLKKLNIYGNDYPTQDGTGVRDYIHVMDLAEGHVAALNYLLKERDSFTVNLGTAKGYSVLELVHAYEQASQKSISYEIVARRPGDIASCYADASLAKKLLGWETSRDLKTMCEDSWRWQSMNPKGFSDA